MWLGIDIGTGGTRALLVDERGGVRAGYTSAHEDIRMERPLWAEQRPENWWDAAVEAIRGVLAQGGVSGGDVRGIGLSGQMHGLVILDRSNQVIRPSLIWCDQRSQAQVDAVNAQIEADAVSLQMTSERSRRLALHRHTIEARVLDRHRAPIHTLAHELIVERARAFGRINATQIIRDPPVAADGDTVAALLP